MQGTGRARGEGGREGERGWKECIKGISEEAKRKKNHIIMPVTNLLVTMCFQKTQQSRQSPFTRHLKRIFIGKKEVNGHWLRSKTSKQMM